MKNNILRSKELRQMTDGEYREWKMKQREGRIIRKEQQKCMEDVCMYCAGRCPQWEKQVSEKPNSAGNYIHKKKGGTLEVLCKATGIISRGVTK